MSSVLKSYQKYDSYSTRRSQNTSNYSYQQETQFQNTFKNNRSYLQLLQHKKEIQQRQWDLQKNTQDQLALEREIEQFKENYDKFMTTVQELTESIQDKETQKNLVVGATAFLGGILSFFTFGISAVVGGIAAYAAKEKVQTELLGLDARSYKDDQGKKELTFIIIQSWE
ncbi:hypothetical protein pb186bvf_001716 [Paramecium bursaria]